MMLNSHCRFFRVAAISQVVDKCKLYLFWTVNNEIFLGKDIISIDCMSYGGYLEKWPFCSITALGSNYNPQNMKYIPAVIIFACLVLKQKF